MYLVDFACDLSLSLHFFRCCLFQFLLLDKWRLIISISIARLEYNWLNKILDFFSRNWFYLLANRDAHQTDSIIDVASPSDHYCLNSASIRPRERRQEWERCVRYWNIHLPKQISIAPAPIPHIAFVLAPVVFSLDWRHPVFLFCQSSWKYQLFTGPKSNCVHNSTSMMKMVDERWRMRWIGFTGRFVCRQFGVQSKSIIINIIVGHFIIIILEI